MKKLLVYPIIMKTFYLLILALLLSACAGPSPKQQMIHDLYEQQQQLNLIEKEIDLGLPKTDEEFYRQLREELKHKNALKI